jgi:sugar lactone lactonase YvrE
MIHQSPYSEGIASAGGNTYWLFDGYHNSIVKYDFGIPHEQGGDDHSDGRVWRHDDLAVNRQPGLSSHLEIDPVSSWLYIADTGNQRILRMDPNSGSIAQNLNPYGETLQGYWLMSGTDWNVVADSNLTYPTGLDIYEDRLLISDYANGDIIIYDISQDPVVELGRIETGLNNEIMGLKVSPEGDIWFVCSNANELYQITVSVIMLGDVNGDGIYTIMDVVLCAQYVMGLSEMDDDELFRSDANSDGVIDVLDVLLIVDLVID